MSSTSSSRNHLFWRITAWISGTVLTLAVLLALGSTVWRLQQSLDLLDQPDTTASTFEDMTTSSLARTKLGLIIGVLTAPVYLISIIKHYRHRRRVGDNTGS